MKKLHTLCLLALAACDLSPSGLAGGKAQYQPPNTWSNIDSNSAQGLCSQGQMKINDSSLISTDCSNFPGYCEYDETPLTGLSLQPDNETLSVALTYNVVKGSYPLISALEYQSQAQPFLTLHYACIDKGAGNFSCIAPAQELSAGAGQSFYLSLIIFKSSLSDETPLSYSDDWGSEAAPCQLRNTTNARKIDRILAPIVTPPTPK